MPIAYKVEIQPLALSDMEGIVAYIAGKLKNQPAAEKLSNDLVEGITSLANFPSRHPLHIPARPLKFEYRKLKVGNYLVFFRVSEEEELVTVVRVLYARSNLDRSLA